MKKAIFAVLVGCASLFAIEDTYENRAKEAARYLEAMHIKSMLVDAIEQNVNSKTKNDAEKKQTKELMKKYINSDEIVSEMKEVMIKHYTADELSAMSDFYATPVGQSIVKKQTAASADMMAKMRIIILKMMVKIMNDKSLQKDKTAPKGEAQPTAI
ncbi:MAG: DUF2059 domain-containing protein [Campylobacterales bacterium]